MANNPSAPDAKGGDKSKFRKELEQPVLREGYRGSGKLQDKVAIITGGDSGIGRSVAAYFAREGADVVVAYNQADDDANETKHLVEQEGRQCTLFKADLGEEEACRNLIGSAMQAFGRVDVLVNNAANHVEDKHIEGISAVQLQRIFASNFYSCFYCSKAAVEVMKEGGAIINTASVVAYRGSGHLLDYSATKGAIVSFTRSLAQNVAKQKIRVNGVAPGPVWTPLVVNSFAVEHLEKFGKDTPLGRAGYPYELGPAYVYLASDDSGYVTGQFIHVNGGDAEVS